MPEYRFCASLRPESGTPRFLFNTPAFLTIHSNKETFSFFLLSSEDQSPLAVVHFQVSDGVASSLPYAPFGFMETTVFDKGLHLGFWEQVEKVLITTAHVRQIVLKAWPLVYWPVCTEALINFFKERGFFIAWSDINFHHKVESRSISSLFHRSEKKRLRKCLKMGFIFEKAECPDIAQVYQLVHSFRAAKHIPFNISLTTFYKSFRQLPEHYKVFLVKDGLKVVALSVCVKVNDSILYHFSLASDPTYAHCSPAVMLYDGIYRYCQQNEFALFDSGIASVEGIKQEGLCVFKSRLGAQISMKHTLIKNIV